MRIALVNHFVPPDKAPTSRVLEELGDGLRKRGWDVHYLGASQGYRQKASTGRSRWLRDIKAHIKILWTGIRMSKPDWVLCLTDPPALVFTAALVARIRGAKMAHWAMDVYPQIAVALGEISKGRLYKIVDCCVNYGYRQADILVALDYDMARVLHERSGLSPDVLPPCPPLLPVDRNISIGQLSPTGRIRWLYSGNLGRSHDYVTLLETQKRLEDQNLEFDLVFQGGGPAWQDAKDYAALRGLKHCMWLEYASDDQLISVLLHSHVLIASQKSETLGLLWPSKLALMNLLPRPIVWVGPPNGATAAALARHSHPSTCAASGDSVALSKWLEQNQGMIRAAYSASLDELDVTAATRDLQEKAASWWDKKMKEALA